MLDYLTLLIDFILHIDQHLTDLANQYGVWIYGILFTIVFIETGLVIMPFLPGDSLLFAAGALAALGKMDLFALFCILWLAAVIGDSLNYWVGRTLGPQVFSWRKTRFFNKDGFEKAHAFFEKHGAKALIAARFMPIVRTFAPFCAGISKLSWPRFIMISLLGGLLWVGSLTTLGYLLGTQEIVRKNLEFVLIAIIFISFLPGFIAFIHAKRSQKTKV